MFVRIPPDEVNNHLSLTDTPLSFFVNINCWYCLGAFFGISFKEDDEIG